MSKGRRCIRITGTRTGKLRARVETSEQVHIGLGCYRNDNHHHEVTIGSARWGRLPRELQDAIILRARRYTSHLIDQLNEHTPPIHISECDSYHLPSRGDDTL